MLPLPSVGELHLPLLHVELRYLQQILQRAKLLRKQYAVVAVGRNRKPRVRAHYHDYAVFIVHYHKTGYVLSRELKNLVNDLEMMVYEQRTKREGQRNRKEHAPKEEKNVHSLQQQRQHQLEQQKKSNGQEQPQHHQYHFDKKMSRRSRHAQFEESGLLNPAIPTSTRIRFDQIGNWIRSAFPVRWHDEQNSCPTGLVLRPGAIYVQESPDLFCDDEILKKAFWGGADLVGSDPPMERTAVGGTSDGDGGGKKAKRYDDRQHLQHVTESTDKDKKKTKKVKIIHFVRNPFDMVISNYLYHSQVPTPEKWVHVDDPCQNLYKNGKSLASHVIPTLVSGLELHSAKNITNASLHPSSLKETMQKNFADIASLCRSLYRSDPSIQNKTFYEHLLHHDKWDGLRLSSAQMIAASSVANRHKAGGDVLRMANNIVRFDRLKEQSKEAERRRSGGGGGGKEEGDVRVLTVSMDDFIKNATTNIMKFMDFVFDGGHDDIDYDSQQEDDHYNHPIMPRNVLWEAAKYQDEYYATKHKKSHHITAQSKSSGEKEEWKALLRNSPELGPILSQTEVLVSKALLSGQ